MADQSYRELYDEVATLRQEMAEAEACDSMLKATQQMVVRADRAVIDAEAKLDRLRQAATRVVQLVTDGADGLVVGEAVAEMQRVLDGGGQ